MIKSVLSAMPLSFMYIFKVPQCVRNEVIKIQRKFLWGWGHDRRRLAWIKWDAMSKPKELGGLGVKSLSKVNKALLGKWKWRLGTEEKGLWRDIIVSKYGSWRNFNDFNNYSNKSLWWKDLKKVCRNTIKGTCFDDSWKWKVGDRKRILF